MALIGGLLGLGDNVITYSASELSGLAFSRSQETAADEFALDLLRRHYGHTGGAEQFFVRLATLHEPLRGALPAFVSTHPSDAGRIARIRASQAGWDPASQPLRPWPKP